MTGELFEIDVTAAMDAPAGPSRLDIDEQESKLNGGELLLTAIDADVIIAAPAAHVVDRKIFYNNSAWDGYDPAANADDDAAIATDKSALLPGGMATFANYTSFIGGITGVMIDLAGPPGTITTSDFAFAAGKDDTPSGRSALAATPTVNLRPGAGEQGSHRIVLTWPAGAIRGTWLEIRVLAGANTGLASDDVFYFGSAPGETGNSPTDAMVNAADFQATRRNPSNFLNPVAIDNSYDYNRDGRVNAVDLLIVRDYATTMSDSLNLISAPASFHKQSDMIVAEKSSSAAKSEGLIEKQPPVAEDGDAPDCDAIDRLLASMASEPDHHDRLLGKFDLADEDEMANDLEASFDGLLREQ